jgi:putative transposase
LQIPGNVILLFQPPYCPDVNPIERLWHDLKQTLQWKLFEGLSELQSATLIGLDD